MNRLAVATVLLLAAPKARALEVGTTVRAPLFDAGALAGGARGAGDPALALPSLDLYFGESLRLRVHALQTIDTLLVDGKDPYLGADLWAPVLRQAFSGPWEAVVGVGGSLDLIASDPVAIYIGAIAPIGVEIGEETRFGLYVEPTLYVSAIGDQTNPAGGASFLAALWF